MRRENAELNAKFLSCEGTLLFNNDYYGSSELEEFACYVVADGIKTGNTEDDSARLATEAVITAFNEAPAISRGALNRYMQAAQKALRENGEKQRKKASVTIVVTDYQKLRYAYAGNSRLHLYRSSRLLEESQDHSLSWEMMEEGQLAKDKIARHKERTNLHCYVGQMKRLSPQISKKIKLKDGDIIALFTRGVWENCDYSDMLAAIQAAENEPAQALENVERLILDSNPGNGRIENYTLCAIFADKIYLDPNRGKKIKTLLKIIVPLFILAVIIAIVLTIWNMKLREKRQNMQVAYLNAIEYTQDNNYIRAKEEIDTAYALATELKDTAKQVEMSNHQKLIEAVIYADDLLEGNYYEAAQEAYLTAEKRSRYADNLAEDYISKKLEKTQGYLNVNDLLILGDTLMEQGHYAMAEEKYLSARRLASSLFYAEGKQQSVESLNVLYEKMQEQETQHQEQAQAEIVAAEFIVQGDNAYAQNDTTGAKLFYQMAVEKYDTLGYEEIVTSIEEKIRLVEEKEAENKRKMEDAAAYTLAGDALMEQEKYPDAKKQFILARDIYSSLGEVQSISEVQSKIDIADGYMSGIQIN